MTHPEARQVEQSVWELMKCRTEHHLSDPAWLGGTHRIAERVSAGRLTASNDPWEAARYCSHYIWGAGED